MSYCSACGNALPPRAGVCAYCGQSITAQRSRWRTVMWVAVAAVAGGAAVLAWQIGLFQPTPSTPASPTVTDSPSVPLPTSTSTTSPELADMVEQVVDGVVRIETSACEGGSTGSGFLIGPDLVATVAHVVEDAVVISLRVGDSGQITAGTVVGIDPSREVALVATGRPLSGHVFTFADNPPRVGADVVALGYPGGAEQMSLTRGTVSGLDREIRAGNSALTDVIETDAVINPGNSGGPLLNTDGQVVGLVEAINTESVGLAYAVSTQTAQPLLEEWASNPNSVSSAACDTPTGSTDGYVDART